MPVRRALALPQEARHLLHALRLDTGEDVVADPPAVAQAHRVRPTEELPDAVAARDDQAVERERPRRRERAFRHPRRTPPEVTAAATAADEAAHWTDRDRNDPLGHLAQGLPAIETDL